MRLGLIQGQFGPTLSIDFDLIRQAESLGYDAVRDVRQGKLFEIELDATDSAAATRLVEELCEKLLSNPVIETYRVVEITDS